MSKGWHDKYGIRRNELAIRVQQRYEIVHIFYNILLSIWTTLFMEVYGGGIMAVQ